MGNSTSDSYASRGGVKLAAALDQFALDVTDLTCADFGSHVGGFVDCLLQRGAARVYAVDTSYGTLAWKLRRDPHVVAFERANAMHVSLPEPVDLITIDVGWTPQARILPNARAQLRSRSATEKKHRAATPPFRTATVRERTNPQDHCDGLGRSAHETEPQRPPGASATPRVVTLIKPHYEAAAHQLEDGVLPDDLVDAVVGRVLDEMRNGGWNVLDSFQSPLRGHGGNREVFALLTPD